mmetsp:Transcript_9091/g.20060  ORF Transcript_9091/g.20060 Transcript_9091/m.20060 type:complete len:413 (-) Transcript_9091:505-1743(-)
MGSAKLSALPRHHHLRVGATTFAVQGENAWPLCLEEPYVLPLPLSLRISRRAGPTCVGFVDSEGEEPITPHHGAVLGYMGAGEVVVLLQRHSGIEAAGGAVVDEEVTQDEVLPEHGLVPKGHARVAKGVDATQPGRGLLGSSHLGEEKAGCRHRGDLDPVRVLCHFVALREALHHRHLRSLEVDPLGDVIANLHADLPLLLGVAEGLVAGLDKTAANYHLQAEFPVGVLRRLIHIPDWRGSTGQELRLNVTDPLDAFPHGGTTSGDDAEEEFRRLQKVSALSPCKQLEEPCLIGLEARPGVPTKPALALAELLRCPLHGSLKAVSGSKFPAQDLLDGGLVVVDLPPGAHKCSEETPASRLHALVPVLGEPKEPSTGIGPHTGRQTGLPLGRSPRGGPGCGLSQGKCPVAHQK